MASKDNNPKFTVIIPTKDRADYLYHSLRSCSLQDYDNLEIIVSDDGSTDHSEEMVREASRKDPRIRFVSPGGGAGMLDNFEFALDQVKEGYVIALGGDDGLLPHGIKGMRDLLNETGKELLAWPSPAYFYAGVKMPTSQMIFHASLGRLKTGQKIIRSEDFLNRQAKDLYYVSDIEAPMFYVKGVASMRLVNQVRARTPGGKFYACATPDGYSGIVLAGEVEDYAFSYTPFSLHGVSPTSAGVGYLSKDARAKEQSNAFFKKAAARPMHADLGSQPYSPLISLMTADYLLTAKSLPGWPGRFSTIDMRSLIQKSIAEVQDGLFAEDRVGRELQIIRGVAKSHGLESFFHQQISGAHRNSRTTLEGNALSTSRIYLNGCDFGIKDLVDAAYFAYSMYNVSNNFNFATLAGALRNSIQYRSLSAKKAAPLPPESTWPSL